MTINKQIKLCVVHSDDSIHLVDHLAPYADLFNCPILVSNYEQFELVQEFYPMVKSELVPFEMILNPFFISKSYDAMISSIFRPKETQKIAFEDPNKKFNKKFFIVYTPHGNSDKGHQKTWMEYFGLEEAAFLYGNRMKEFLKEKNAYHPINYKITVGNLRYMFFQKHKKFFQKKADDEIFSNLSKNMKTILYAPTWYDDMENSSTFFEVYKIILDALSKKYNIIVKLHPNFYNHRLLDVIRVENEYKNNKNIHFLNYYPHVFPLLEKADIFLGDFSSINYDFLLFNKPMFFFHHDKWEETHKNRFIINCGFDVPINQYKTIDKFIESNLKNDNKFHSIRKKIYEDTFDSKITKESIIQDFEKAYFHYNQ